MRGGDALLPNDLGGIVNRHYQQNNYCFTVKLALMLYITQQFIIFCFHTDNFVLLGSHAVSVRAKCNVCRICRLSVPRQISKTKQDRHKISSLLWEISVAEQEYDIRFCTRSRYLVSTTATILGVCETIVLLH